MHPWLLSGPFLEHSHLRLVLIQNRAIQPKPTAGSRIHHNADQHNCTVNITRRRSGKILSRRFGLLSSTARSTFFLSRVAQHCHGKTHKNVSLCRLFRRTTIANCCRLLTAVKGQRMALAPDTRSTTRPRTETVDSRLTSDGSRAQGRAHAPPTRGCRGGGSARPEPWKGAVPPPLAFFETTAAIFR